MITALSSFFATGILMQQGEALSLNQAVLLQLPVLEQQDVFRKLYLHVIQNNGDPAVVTQVRHWAISPAKVHENLRAKREFLTKLEEELRRLHRPSVEETMAKSSRTIPAASPAPVTSGAAPRFWENMHPQLRMTLIRNAIAADVLGELGENTNKHALFLVDQIRDWTASKIGRSTGLAAALLAAINAIHPGLSPRCQFWDHVYEDAALTERLDGLLLKADSPTAKPPAAPEEGKLVSHYVAGLIVHLTFPLTEDDDTHAALMRRNSSFQARWQEHFSMKHTQPFLNEERKSRSRVTVGDSSTHQGQFLARHFLGTARYAMTLTPDMIRSSSIRLAVETDFPVLRHMLIFAGSEAMRSDGDAHFLRSFWQTFCQGTKERRAKDVVQSLVMLMMVQGLK